MPLNELQLANLRSYLIPKESVIDSATGLPLDWSSLGGATSQPLDSDLTAIAALTTTSYGRAFLALADAAAGRTALGLGTAATQATGAFDAAGAAAAAQAASQSLDSDLTAIAALTTTSYGRALLALADQAALSALVAKTFNVAVPFIIDGAGSAITTGLKGGFEVPFAGTITAVRLLADQSGSIVINLWKDTYANYPPTVADAITASAKPTLSSATKSQDSTLTGWTTSIAAGDIIFVNVDSITTVTRVILSLTISRSI